MPVGNIRRVIMVTLHILDTHNFPLHIYIHMHINIYIWLIILDLNVEHTHTLKSPKVFFQTSPVIMFFVSCPVLSPVSWGNPNPRDLTPPEMPRGRKRGRLMQINSKGLIYHEYGTWNGIINVINMGWICDIFRYIYINEYGINIGWMTSKPTCYLMYYLRKKEY